MTTTAATTATTATSTTGEDFSDDWKWIFYGNIVIPTGNPFRAEASIEENQDDDSHIHWLGPSLKLCLHHVLIVNHAGIIVDMCHQEENMTMYENHPGFVRLAQHEFLCPGFIDLHIHAPQFAYTGTGTHNIPVWCTISHGLHMVIL